MTQPSHFWEPAFPLPEVHSPNGDISNPVYYGLSQYAEVAARFHAALLPEGFSDTSSASRIAFDHADAFFAELTKRTKS